MVKKDRKNFNDFGFLVKENLLDKVFIKKLDTEFEKIISQLKSSGENINAKWNSSLTSEMEPKNSEVIHTHNVQSYSSIMLELVQNKKILNVFESLIGPNIILHHTKLFLKPGNIGSAFPLHQDWSYFPTKNNSMIAAIVHISDSSEEMGCIRLVPTSNKAGRIDLSDGHSFNKEIHGKYDLESAIPIIAKKGDVLFFDSCTIHGSMANRAKEPRKTILIQVYSGNDKIIKKSDHTNVQLALRGWNYNLTRNTADKL